MLLLAIEELIFILSMKKSLSGNYFIFISLSFIFNNSYIVYGKIPSSSSFPIIVWVFPEFVTPYANISPPLTTQKYITLAKQTLQ